MKAYNLIALILGLSVPAALVASTPEEQLEEARVMFHEYKPSAAISKLNAINRVKLSEELQEEIAELKERVGRMQTMMQRVDGIEVIDSLNVPRYEFFAHYMLAPSAGQLVGVEADSVGVIYMPENSSFRLWSGEEGLMRSQRLTDGSWDEPEALGDVLNTGGRACYPFLMPDGVTLYYASEGDDSLGGLDIYMSRSNDGEFPAPQNIGMPYNSPFNDYMMAIDEETGAGWWATDRNYPDTDSLTIYVFIPSEMRVNVDVDDPKLADRAAIRDITDSWSEDASKREAVYAKIDNMEAAPAKSEEAAEFEFVLPDGRVYTRLDDFESDQAADYMNDYLDALDARTADQKKLDELRRKYGAGDKSTANEILKLEKKMLNYDAQLRRLANKVITEETR